MSHPDRRGPRAHRADRHRLAGHRFAVPMTGEHVRRVFDEWCRPA